MNVPLKARGGALRMSDRARAALATTGRPSRVPSGAPLLMRYPWKRPPDGPEAVPAPPVGSIIALNRMGFGPRPGDLAAFDALGATDPARLAAYVALQLDPASIDDSDADARLAAAGFESLDKSLTELWADYVASDPEFDIRMIPFNETVRATFLRIVYSRRQLLEILADFWHNHFNVMGSEFHIAPTFVYTDRDVIRANALGDFRVMVEMVAQSPAMMYFLDNRDNSEDGPNENYARELLELHSLGGINYLGSIPQGQVPLDEEGRPVGYVDEDVTALARALTGWTLRDRPNHPDFGDTGEFFVYEEWHDTGPKHLLGVDLPAGQPGLVDGRQALDVIAAHPATAGTIARKLAQRLIGDTPAEGVVEQAAAVFAANLGAPDQIARTVEAVLFAPEFLATWADKVKRPLEIATSAMRAVQAEWPFSTTDPETDNLLFLYYQAGQPVFERDTPFGYPDVKTDWNTTSPRVLSWRLCNRLTEVSDGAGGYRVDLLGQTPPGVRSARQLSDFWATRVLGQLMPPADQEELMEFMAQGSGPDLPLPLDTDPDVQSRLRAMVALILLSPSFLWK